MFSFVRYQGQFHRVLKQPFESEEQAKDRAWYVAKLSNDTPANMRENMSRIWANEKYYHMKYQSKHDGCGSQSMGAVGMETSA